MPADGAGGGVIFTGKVDNGNVVVKAEYKILMNSTRCKIINLMDCNNFHRITR